MSGFVFGAPASVRNHGTGAKRAVCNSSARTSHLRRSAVKLVVPADVEEMGQKFAEEDTDPVDVMSYALDLFPGEVAIAFSGAEDVVLLEYARRTGKQFRVFALDTGRLPPETYRFFAEAEKYFGLRIEYCFPQSSDVEKLVNEKGLFSFYEDGHKECCGVRKVRPLRAKLSTLRAWITGQRRDQSPSTRSEVAVTEIDSSFKGSDGKELVKINPLANVSSAEVWAMIRQGELPYNKLHERGYNSIGCEPCTKSVLPNQHEREGRWWWEESTIKECGLHSGNSRTPNP